jgi:voltage-gated sodium channel
MTDLPAHDGRQRVRAWIERPRVQNFIIALILLNAALLGLETSAGAMAAAGGMIVGLDRAILAVFVVEIALRLYAHRAAFWRDPWSVFDFAVVAIALLPATGPLAVLRALRVLRVLRLLTMVPSMRRVVGALLAAIPGLGSIALVLLIIYYVFAVIATNLFATTHPEWFGDIGRSLYTLFQIMTLESWSMGIARPVMETFPTPGLSSSPSSWWRPSPCSTCSSPSSSTPCKATTTQSSTMRERPWTWRANTSKPTCMLKCAVCATKSAN